MVHYKLQSSVTSQSYVTTFDAVQGDTLRSIEVSIVSNHRPWPVPEGLTASVAYSGPGEVRGWYDTMPDGSAACSIEGNVVTARLAPAMFTAAGTVNASVVLLDGGGKQISTFPFRLNVARRPGAEDLSSPYYNVSSLEQLNAALDDIRRRLAGLDPANAGQLMYISPDGALAPLKLGPGLSIRDGVLYVSGGTDESVGVVEASADSDGILHVYLDGVEVPMEIDADGYGYWPGLTASVDADGHLIIERSDNA